MSASNFDEATSLGHRLPRSRTPGEHERTQLPQEVASYVREMILSGAVRPGEFLRLEPIAEALGVSNTPVREGLLALRGEGFVRLIPRRGFVVQGFSRQDVLDLFLVQADIAGELAARAAVLVTPGQLAELEAIQRADEQAIAADDREAIARLGHSFHRNINVAADSRRLAILLGSVVRHFPNRFYVEIDGQIASIADKHPLILAALRSHDPEAARMHMREHILDEGKRLVESLQQRGIWSDEAPNSTHET